MNIALFAIIGATINAGTAYWICFSLYSMCWAVRFFCKIFELFRDL